jgi:NAD(P)H-quinone oxidoreductase subunit 5
MLRAPSLLRDYHALEDAIGGHLHHDAGLAERLLPRGQRLALYRMGFHRGQLDAALDRFVVRPFLHVFRWCDRMERRWTDLLAGRESRESARVVVAATSGEDV